MVQGDIIFGGGECAPAPHRSIGIDVDIDCGEQLILLHLAMCLLECCHV